VLPVIFDVVWIHLPPPPKRRDYLCKKSELYLAYAGFLSREKIWRRQTKKGYGIPYPFLNCTVTARYTAAISFSDVLPAAEPAAGTIVMAFFGQRASHMPQPMHFVWSTLWSERNIPEIAFTGIPWRTPIDARAFLRVNGRLRSRQQVIMDRVRGALLHAETTGDAFAVIDAGQVVVDLDGVDPGRS